MNKSIEKMIDILINDEKLCEGLIEQKNMDDVCKFCMSIQDGYTEDELMSFFDVMLNEEFGDDPKQELDESDARKITGGAKKNIGMKIAAYSLSALTLTPMINTATQKNVMATSNTTASSKSSQKKEESFWEKNKKWIIGLGLAGVAALLGCGAYYWYYKRGSSQPATPATPADGQQPQVDLSQQAETKAKRWHRMLRNMIYDLRGVGSVAAGVGVVGYLINDWLSILHKISKYQKTKWEVQGFWESVSDKFTSFRKWITGEKEKELVLGDSYANLDVLFSEIKGQKKAKEQVRSLVFGILHNKNNAKISGKKYDHGDVLYFAGPSGVGKTLMARGLAKYNILSTNTEPFYVSASDVDKEGRGSVVEQLFGIDSYGRDFGMDYSGGGSGRNIVSSPKNLVRYLTRNPDGIVIIDEYDKMWSPGLDEVFRTILDHGVINLRGQKIDCSGITFILTSNESEKSIRGENDTPAGVVDDDGTLSRTRINHDKSFLNRIAPVIFENLELDEYAQIIKIAFKDDLVRYWAIPEVGGIDVVIDDNCLTKMAEVVRVKNQGARYIAKFQSDLFRDITIKVLEAEQKYKKKDFYCGKEIYVSFDSENESFILTDNADKPAETE